MVFYKVSKYYIKKYKSNLIIPTFYNISGGKNAPESLSGKDVVLLLQDPHRVKQVKENFIIVKN